VASEPFCKLDVKLELPLAGPQTEQFALGSCIYAIRFGHMPLHHIDPPVRVRKLSRGEFPPTSSDHFFGEIISRCWHGKYGSIRAAERDVVAVVGKDGGNVAVYSGIGSDAAESLLAECKGYLARASRTERGNGAPVLRAAVFCLFEMNPVVFNAQASDDVRMGRP